MTEIVNGSMQLEAAMPDGTRETISVPIGCMPRSGDVLAIAGRVNPNGDLLLFEVAMVYLQAGRTAQQFSALLMLTSFHDRPGLRLVR